MDARLLIPLLVLVQLLLEASGEVREVWKGFCPGSPCECVMTPSIKLRAVCSNSSLASVQSAKLPPSIDELLLDHNDIEAVIGRDLASFQNLTFLDLSFNDIQHLADDAFANLLNLKYLNLENNSLELSELSTDVFSTLESLETLKLNGNPIVKDYPDAALSKLVSLRSLSIDGVEDVEFGPGFKELSNLTTLLLSGSVGSCNITNLTSSAFQNVSHLQVLNISSCGIEMIEPRAFLPLRNLHTLDISGNYRLGFKVFGKGMEGITSNLTKLFASSIVQMYASCVTIKKEYIENLSNTSLTHLYLDGNSIESLERGTLPLLPKTLEYISAERNKFSYGSYLRDLHTMTGLKQVSFSGRSYAITTPEHDDEDYACAYSNCDDGDDDQGFEDFDWLSSIMPSHSHWLGEPDEEPVKMFNISLPPNLETVNYNFTQLTFKIGVLQFQAYSLRRLDLSSNLVQFQTGQLRGLENVTYIDLSNNLARQMSGELFYNCGALEHLDLSYNFFGWQIRKNENGSIFHNLLNLKTLDLANNDMLGFSGYVISNLTSLQTLNISHNGLFNFAPRIKQLTNLVTLDASYNQIKWLNKTTMQDLAHIKHHSRNFTLILRGNPLVCDCNNLDTLEWLYTSGVTPHDMNGYYCLMTNREARSFNTTPQFEELIDDMNHKCKNNFGLALGCVAIFIAVIGLMVGSMLYRYRWKLRYLYYAARLRYLADNEPDEDEEEFIFDAFVSYADEDRSFVINDMRARLEHEASMTLNIHHRDFMPGEPIVSNIVGAIKKSRKMLVLLSPNFLKSYWCKYELHMAQMESISTGRDIIIVIMYESVPAKNIPPEFLQLLQSDSYIEYPRTESDVPVFWSHLNAAIRRRTHRYGSQSSQVSPS